MAWIESHQGMERHPKTLLLRSSVKWNLDETIGFLHRFWWWALDTAPDGVVTDVCKPGVCGEAFGLRPDIGDKVIAAMIGVGWLDRHEDGTVSIHNYEKYRGRLSDIREQNRVRQQRRRLNLKGIQDNGKSGAMSRFCHANTTEHNITETTSGEEEKPPLEPPPQSPEKPKVVWNGSDFTIPDVFYEKWETAYPGVNVSKEINKAAAWLVANPKKAKKDYARFLNGWMGRAKPEASPDDSYSLDPVLEAWAEEAVARGEI